MPRAKNKDELLFFSPEGVIECLMFCSAGISSDPQSIKMESLGNARQLGGYPSADGRSVRQGLLLRSARLASASPSDIKRLTQVYHLGTVCDLG